MKNLEEEKKQDTITQAQEWTKNAPLCICETERVLFMCFEPTCPSYLKSRLYCMKCMLGKTDYKHRLHDHLLIEDEF